MLPIGAACHYQKTRYSRSVKIYRFVCIKNFGAKIPHRYLAPTSVQLHCVDSLVECQLWMHYICAHSQMQWTIRLQFRRWQMAQTVVNMVYKNETSQTLFANHIDSFAVKTFSIRCSLFVSVVSVATISIFLTCYMKVKYKSSNPMKKLSRVTILFSLSVLFHHRDFRMRENSMGLRYGTQLQN